MKRIAISLTLAAFLLCGCTGEPAETLPQEPVYNSAKLTTSRALEPEETENIGETAKTEETAETAAPAPKETRAEIKASPVTDLGAIMQGNRFEETVAFGHFCPVENGFYFVDLNDGFLYFMDRDGNRKTVLEDYVRALNYYDGFLYYIKGTKREFYAKEHFYAGSVWRLDPASGEEVCLIDVPENLVLIVNKYGIFCNPNGGGLARYDFDGKEVERLSDKNQGAYFIGNKLHLINDGKTVLRDFDAGEESDFPNDMFLFALIGDRVICADQADQWTKIVLNLSDGSSEKLPQNMAFAFAVCGGELYAIDNNNLYRVDLEKFDYESIVSYPLGNPTYFFALHSDGERLYAVMRNQSNVSKLVEVDTNSGALKDLEGGE